MKKQITLLCSAALLLSCTAAVLPQQFTASDYALTVSAAEADYDWAGFLKKDASWFGSGEAIKIAAAKLPAFKASPAFKEFVNAKKAAAKKAPAKKKK